MILFVKLYNGDTGNTHSNRHQLSMITQSYKYLQKLCNYILTSLEIEALPVQCRFFYRNTIDNFHTKTIFFHWHNDKRKPISI